MKTLVLILFLVLGSALAFGQVPILLGNSPMNSQIQPLQFYSNPQHATHHPMGEEQSLLQPSAYTHAQGERPLWEVARFPEATPLGDVARALREEHMVLKKSEVVWVNQ